MGTERRVFYLCFYNLPTFFFPTNLSHVFHKMFTAVSTAVFTSWCLPNLTTSIFDVIDFTERADLIVCSFASLGCSRYMFNPQDLFSAEGPGKSRCAPTGGQRGGPMGRPRAGR